MKKLTTEDIDAICHLVDDLCGIYWDESKSYLMEARLESLADEQGCESYRELVRMVRAELVPGLREQVVDAVTVNETLWFRDGSPFEAIQFKLLPEMIDEKASTPFPRRLRIWSAACSTGQEVYSLAMTLCETIPDAANWDIKILGTDISQAALDQAKRGVYNKLEISRGMKPVLKSKYFREDGNSWRVRDEIKAMCSFEQRNLQKPFVGLGPFDFVFCRNVAIYFNSEDRRAVFEKVADVLSPSGWVFVGSSESLTDLGERWQPQQHCRANCYRPNMERVIYVK